MAGDRSPGICRRRTRPRRIFPFRLRQQSVRIPSTLTQPAHVILRIAPGHADDGMTIVLREAGVAPGAFRVRFRPGPAAVCITARGCNERGPLASRHNVLASGELGDLHTVLWAFPFVATRLGVRPVHPHPQPTAR